MTDQQISKLKHRNQGSYNLLRAKVRTKVDISELKQEVLDRIAQDKTRFSSWRGLKEYWDTKLELKYTNMSNFFAEAVSLALEAGSKAGDKR